VFAPKYRRQEFYEARRLEVGSMFRKLCEWKGLNLLEGEVCKDHVHMLLEITPKYSVSSVMGYLKGKSSVMIYEKWINMKYKYKTREFWCRGYYVDTVGKNTIKIQEYIKSQLKEDKESDELLFQSEIWKSSRKR
jgi:putative transposase